MSSPTIEDRPLRRSQGERRDATRRAILDAALATLVADGYQGLTTTAVVKRAGLSQGALFRYYPTKADLLAGTVEHLFATTIGTFTAAAPRRGGIRHRVEAALDSLWEAFRDPCLLAALELYSAARTDANLAEHLRPVMEVHHDNILVAAHRLFPELAEAMDADFDGFVELVVYTMQGLALNQLGHPDDRVIARVLHQLAAQALAAAGNVPPRRRAKTAASPARTLSR